MTRRTTLMTRRTTLILSLLILLLVAVPLVMTDPGDGERVFVGSDNQGVDLIGRLAPGYEPWIVPLWSPPNAVIESMIFSLQAALGGGLFGFVLGYWVGQRRVRDDGQDRRDS